MCAPRAGAQAPEVLTLLRGSPGLTPAQWVLVPICQCSTLEQNELSLAG